MFAFLVVALGGFAYALLSVLNVQAVPDEALLRAQVQAANMLVYRNVVVDYVRANPGASGTVGDASLSLPTWYSNVGGWTNTVASGKVYVYPANPTALPVREFSEELVKAAQGSIFAGINRGGTFVFSGPAAAPSITLPPEVPNNAQVLYYALN